jgi:hypothetical protein
LNATKKASVAIPAPKTLATMASRAKPSTRENMVIELTAASDFNKFINVNFHNHTAKRLQSRRNECPTALRLRRPSDLQAG